MKASRVYRFRVRQNNQKNDKAHTTYTRKENSILKKVKTAGKILNPFDRMRS